MQCQWKNAVWIKSALVSSGSVLWRSRIPSIKRVVRWYTVQPPDWLGGKNMLIRSGRWDFPEHGQTFDEKMRSNCFYASIFVLVLSVIKPYLCILFHIEIWLG